MSDQKVSYGHVAQVRRASQVSSFRRGGTALTPREAGKKAALKIIQAMRKARAADEPPA